MIDDEQKNKLLEHLQQVEENIDTEDIYVGFNGLGHLKFIQATREGLIKLGIFMIKSAFENEKYIQMNSEYKTLEWLDPDETDPIDYVEIIDNKKDCLTRKKNKEDTRNSSLKDCIAFLMILIIIGIIIGIVAASSIGVIVIIRNIISSL